MAKLKVPADIIQAVRKDFAALGRNSVVGDVDKFLPAFAGGKVPYFAPDVRPPLERLNPFTGGRFGLDPNTAWKLASLISWLFVNRPVGDPLRAEIPRVVKALRAVLDNKRTSWNLETQFGAEKPAKRTRRHAELMKLVGGKPVVAPKRPGNWVDGRDDGTVILAPLRQDHEDAEIVGAFWTAALTAKTSARVSEFSRALSGGGHGAFATDDDPRATAQWIRDDGFTALGARVSKTDVPKGGFEANPLASAIRLVAKVAAAHGITKEAAALYLQTLALAEPTTANVLRWNAWTMQTYDLAMAELVAKKLVVAQKVDGAGRKHFAPGKIVKKTKLNLPLEADKQELYRHGQHIKHVLPEPCHSLFERAYDRVRR